MEPVWNGGSRWQFASGTSYAMRQTVDSFPQVWAPSYAMRQTAASFPQVWHLHHLETPASQLCIVAEVCHGSADTDTCRREPNGHDLEPLDPLVEAAESPSFVAFCTTGPPIADDSESVHIELQSWTQQLELGREQSGQRATVAPGETLSVSARTNKRHHHHH